MSRIFSRLVVAQLLLMLTAVCAAQALRYSVDKSEPQSLVPDGESGPIAFGPVQLSFPRGWRFQRVGNLSKGQDLNGTTAFVSVLVAAEVARKEGNLTEQTLAIARVRAAAETKEACGTAQEPIVEVIRSDARTVVYASGCEEKSHNGIEFAVRYDIYSLKGVVQLMLAGTGGYVQARASFDQVAQSHTW